MRHRFTGLGRTLLVLALAVGLGWAAGSWMGGTAARTPASLSSESLSIGSELPDLPVLDSLGGSENLRALVRTTGATVVVILSAKCSSCVGELESWKDLSVTESSVRPLVLVYANDPAYLQSVQVHVAPSYPVRVVREEYLPRLGARIAPTVYQLSAQGTVNAAAVGVRDCAALRTLMTHNGDERS